MRPTLPRITPGVQDHVSLVSYPAGMFIARCALALDLPRCNMRVRWRACRRSGSVVAGARPHRLRKRQRLDAHAHALCAASASLRMPVSACHLTPRAPQRTASQARAAQRRAALHGTGFIGRRCGPATQGGQRRHRSGAALRRSLARAPASRVSAEAGRMPANAHGERAIKKNGTGIAHGSVWRRRCRGRRDACCGDPRDGSAVASARLRGPCAGSA